MQDPDPQCRHFVISWHFMAFWHVCQKANCITKSAFSAFSRLFPPLRLFHRIRLLDFSALVESRIHDNLSGEKTWRRGRSLHHSTAARLSTSPGEIFSFLELKMISAPPSVQARPEVGQAAWCAHPNKVMRSFQVSEKFEHIAPQACHHICALAVHQDPQAAGST